MYFEEEREIGLIKSYINDKGNIIIVSSMNDSHLLHAYTKYLKRTFDGDFSKYKHLVNSLKHEILRRLNLEKLKDGYIQY